MNIVSLKQVGRWATIALIGLTVLSCKKDNPKPEPEPEPTDRTEGQLIKDDIYKYYKLYSLWADEYIVPDYSSKPWEFTDKYNSATAVLEALKKMTPAHAAYSRWGGVLDRFSFVDGINGYDVSGQASTKMDNSDGYGISVQWFSIDSKTAQPYISFVEGGSPAQIAGFRRSDIITAVNNDKENYSVEVTCADKTCQVKDAATYNRLRNNINTALDAGNLTLQVQRPNNQVFKKEIVYTSYPINPIYKDTVYINSGNNVGYLALSSFEEIDNVTSGGKTNKANTDAAFSKFQNMQIKSLIVDLRYNGGGYVDAAVYIADKIGGAKTKGKLMLTYEMNKYMQSDAAKGLREQLKMYDTNFEGLSALNLNKVYFLVSEETASAAEMLINVLTPHMNVEIIATDTRTYGKPVGFFEQKIQNKASYWPASFILKNSRGNLGEKYNNRTEANLRDYWDGLVPDQVNIGDDVSSDAGNPQERMVATALADAAPTSKSKAALRASSTRSLRIVEQGKIHTRPERGMIKRISR